MGQIDLENTYRWSRFTHFIQVDGAVAIYNSLNLAVMFVQPELVSMIEPVIAGSTTLNLYRETDMKLEEVKELLSQLLHLKLLVTSGHDELSEYNGWKDVLSSLPVGVLYLLLTDSCNLACNYCVIMGGFSPHYKHRSMSIEIAKRGVDLFAQVLRRQEIHPDVEKYHLITNEPDIILYGGEPLLNLPVLRYLLSYIRRSKEAGNLPETVKVSLNTNGTLITPELAALLSANDVTVSISLDGLKKHHDAVRPYVNNVGSFDDVMKGLRFLKDAGATVSISCTLWQHNLDEAPIIVDWFINDLNISSFGFNLFTDSETVHLGNVKEYAKQASEVLLTCFQKARQAGVYEDRIMRKARSFVEGRIYLNDCAGCGQQIVVAPNGQLGVCQAYLGSRQYFTAFDATLDTVKHPFWQEWRMRSPLNMPQCIDCPALGICGGGCPHDAQMRGESIWSLDEVFCIHAKETLKFLINDLWRNMSQQSAQQSVSAHV